MKKVVILIPAYNVENYISKTLDSFLKQDCDFFDILIVNDGSTDNTKEVILSYKNKFDEKGINLTVIDKENGGAASAINVGLKQKLNYEYILIMDGDDWLPYNSISKRVDFLDNNKDYGACIGWTNLVDEETGIITSKHYSLGITEDKEETFLNILNVVDIIYTGYLFRLKELKSVLKNNQIFESHGGQNWQLLLPFSKAYKIKVMPFDTLNYLVRKQSHSHSVIGDYEKIKNRLTVHKQLIEETFDRMNQREKYQEILDNRYNRLFANNAFSFRQKKDFMKYYKNLKKSKRNTFKDFLKKWYLRILVRG